MAVQSDSLKHQNTLSKPVLSLFNFNWELALYALLLIIAIVTRFYDLGSRVMSHDESLHTVYSWNLYAGKGYVHDPLMHGPFLFHINALIYFLFGDNDFTARISTALFGAVLVVLPYWFRPWLGRLGALSTSFMILISPGLLYYSRYIRHDIFISVWTVLMFLAFFQYMRYRRNTWLYIGAAAIALMLSTKEVAFIHGFIGATFIALIFLWENVSRQRRLTLTLFLLVAALFTGILAGVGFYLIEAESEPNFLTEEAHLLVMIVCLILSFILTQIGTDYENRPVTTTIQSLAHNIPDLVKAILVAVVIFTLLYTTFFSNIAGLYSGTIGAVVYWIGQQDVHRGGQPWYYYLFLTPMYEFLPVTVGVIGGLLYLFGREILRLIKIITRPIAPLANILPDISPGPLKLPDHTTTYVEDDDSLVAPTPGENEVEERTIWPSDGGMFASLIIYWSLVSIIIYTWAGEKMPWLTVHMTLPLIFVSGHVIQTVFNRFQWGEAKRSGGITLGLGVLLLIPAVIALLTAQPFQGQSFSEIEGTIQFVVGLILIAAAGATIWYFWQRMGGRLAARTIFVALLIPFILLTVRFTWLLSYINYDYVSEMLVYAHASPDVKLALSQIEEISQRTVGDKMIKVAYDNDSTWPLEWYLREYPNRAYYGENPSRDALDAPIVIVGSANESKVKPYLGNDYIQYPYRLVWWPIEDYKGQTFENLWQLYVTGPPAADPALDTAEAQQARRAIVADNWRKLLKIVFYRDYEDYSLDEWPFVHRFNLYVRRDVAAEVWPYDSGPIDQLILQQEQFTDPYDGKRTELDSSNRWGSNGNADGQFVTPRNIAVGPDGSVYVADSGNHRIQVFDTAGNHLLEFGNNTEDPPGAKPGEVNEPWGLAVGSDGTVYVADTWNHRIQAFSANGEFLWQTGTFANAQGDATIEPGNFWGPRDITIDGQGNLYVTDTGNKRIQKFSPDGQFIDMWGGGGIVPGTFEEPVGIEVDSQGNIYVADTWNRRIQKFDAEFNQIGEWDVVGWESDSVVNKPYLAIDAQDRIYISDPESYRIIVYDNEGEVLVTWGQYGQDIASFALPVGLDIDQNGTLFVADADNNRILTFDVPEVAFQSSGG